MKYSNQSEDTTGAGDAFTGAFLVEWMTSHDISRALKAGCIAGSGSCTKIGGSTCPDDKVLQEISTVLSY